MSDLTYISDAWKTEEVLDPVPEPETNKSIINVVYEHSTYCVCHFIMTNYTWKETDIGKLMPFYKTLLNLEQKIGELQENLEKTAFGSLTKRLGLIHLPVYSRSVDSSHLVTESGVYHDAKDFLENGSAKEPDLYNFVSATLKTVLEPLFSSKEIRKVIKELISSLMKSQKRDEHIGDGVKKNLNYELASIVSHHMPDFPGFHENMSSSITKFIGYLALHTIRHHCYVNFGVDGELKIYQREMYNKAVEDLRTEKNKTVVSVKHEKCVKIELTNRPQPTKKTTIACVKREATIESDDDFCEIIEPAQKNNRKRPKTSECDSEPSKNLRIDVHQSDDFPEKHMLVKLDRDELPMNFRTRFRKVVEENQSVRAEIKEYRALIQLKIAEKQQKLNNGLL